MDTVNHFAVMRAFLCVLEYGSFSAAAKALGVAASTLTRQISALEQQLGVDLFVRSTHGLALTEAGQLYRNRASGLLAELDDTLREVADVVARPSGLVRLLSPVAFGRVHISPLLPKLLQLYPEIRLEVHLSDLHHDLPSSGFDLDIHEGESYLDNLVVQTISSNRLVLCASPAYLERYGRPTHPEQLLQHNCLSYQHPEGSVYWDLQRGEENFRIPVKCNLSSNHSELLLDAVCAGVGIYDCEVWLVRDRILRGELEVVLPQYERKSRLTGDNIYLAYLPNRRLSSKVQAVRDFLLQHLAGVGELP